LGIKVLITSEKLEERMRIRSFLKELPFGEGDDPNPLSISEEPPNQGFIMFMLSRHPKGSFYDLVIASNSFGRVQQIKLVDLVLSEKNLSSPTPFIIYDGPPNFSTAQKAAMPENIFLFEGQIADLASLRSKLEEISGILVAREDANRKTEMEALMANMAAGKKVGNFPAQIESIYLASANRVLAYKKYAPWHYAPYLSLSRIYTGCNKFETVIQYAKTAVKINPNSVEAHRLLALAYKKTGRSFEELEALMEMLKETPESSTVLLKVGEALLRKGNYRDAERYFVEAIKKYRPDQEARSFARMHVGLGKTFVAAAEDGKNGNTLQMARDQFHKAINIFPLLMSAYNDLVLVYKKLGQYEEASKIITLAMEIAPSTPEDWVSLFGIFLADGDEKKARVCLDKAIKFDPENQIILCLAAEAYVRQGLIPDAITLLEKAVLVNPSDPRLYNFLGDCSRQLSRHQQALGHYLKAAKLEPDDATLHFNLGNAYWNINDPVSAKLEYETALRLNPGMEEARVELDKFSGSKTSPVR